MNDYAQDRLHAVKSTHRRLRNAARVIAMCVMPIATASSAFAQSSYPTQPIRFIVTTAPGAGLDSCSRLLARELTQRAGQQVIVDNRPGAGTTIGTAVA